MKDSLAAHGWKLKSIEQWKKSTNTIVSKSDLSPEQLSDVLHLNADGNWVSNRGSGKWSLVGKVLTIGDQVYTLTYISDSKLNYEQDDRYVSDQIIKFFYEAAP